MRPSRDHGGEEEVVVPLVRRVLWDVGGEARGRASGEDEGLGLVSSLSPPLEGLLQREGIPRPGVDSLQAICAGSVVPSAAWFFFGRVLKPERPPKPLEAGSPRVGHAEDPEIVAEREGRFQLVNGERKVAARRSLSPIPAIYKERPSFTARMKLSHLRRSQGLRRKVAATREGAITNHPLASRDLQGEAELYGVDEAFTGVTAPRHGIDARDQRDETAVWTPLRTGPRARGEIGGDHPKRVGGSRWGTFFASFSPPLERLTVVIYLLRSRTGV
ncbi:hypothetical protein CPLU01_08255 [Colletotrichum plurivorum]|uniref:Uncharacterized protein n=1 Tax=Colletotrichum plurivorum TaxID=2175906 RepID=A0A8H6KCH7_9PEZI|nr:hypothetical protein CPLU01_08255 [Colletotrichum plurivorum]